MNCIWIPSFYKARGKKITCPGALDKLNCRQDKHIFSPKVLRTSKKFTDSLFYLDKDKLFGKRTSKKFDVFARGTTEIFLIFLPLKALKLLGFEHLPKSKLGMFTIASHQILTYYTWFLRIFIGMHDTSRFVPLNRLGLLSNVEETIWLVIVMQG